MVRSIEVWKWSAVPVLITNHTKLSDKRWLDLCNLRSRRSIAEQAQKVMATSRKLKAYLRVVECHPTDAQKMICVVGTFNSVVKVLHFYDITCNERYPIGRPITCPVTLNWLNTSTTGARSSKHEVQYRGGKQQRCQKYVTWTEKMEIVPPADLEIPEIHEKEARKNQPAGSCRQLPWEEKAAKAEKRAKFEKDT